MLICRYYPCVADEKMRNIDQEESYVCEVCDEWWEFFPEDYNNFAPDYPTICPICSMPILEMMRDVYEVDGVMGVIRHLLKRIYGRFR